MPSTLQLSNSNVLFISIKFLTVDAHEPRNKGNLCSAWWIMKVLGDTLNPVSHQTKVKLD